MLSLIRYQHGANVNIVRRWDLMGELQGKSFDLAGMVEYQEGSIVSRQILKGDTGTITLFAFDAGEALSEHTVPFEALIHVIEGKALIRIGEDELLTEKGEACILPAGKPHSVRAEERFKMMLIMLRR